MDFENTANPFDDPRIAIARWKAEADDRILNRNADAAGIEIVDPTELVRRLNP